MKYSNAVVEKQKEKYIRKMVKQYRKQVMSDLRFKMSIGKDNSLTTLMCTHSADDIAFMVKRFLSQKYPNINFNVVCCGYNATYVGIHAELGE